MKAVLMGLALATSFATTAFADDPNAGACTRADLHSAVNVDPGYAGVKSVGPVYNTQTGIQQMIILSDNQKVVYAESNCGVYNFSFSYPWAVASVEPLSDYDLQQLALQMLGETVTLNTESYKVQWLIDAVKAANVDPSTDAPKYFESHIGLRCGDSNCSLDRNDHSNTITLTFTNAD